MAGTTHAVTSRPTTLSPSSSSQQSSVAFSLQDALVTLSYLSGRGLLCTSCGTGWAEVDNQIHTHCSDCKRPNMTYNVRIGKGTDLDKLLCRRLSDWVSAFLQGDKAAPANAADSKGKR